MSLYVRTILITAPPASVEGPARDHERHLADLRRRGKLQAAGRLGNGDGYLEIIEAVDLLEADEIARASPLIELGLGSWTLREWVPIDPEG
jgi:uncharacterized protein YciI